MSLIKSDDFSAANDGWELNWLAGWTKHATYNVTMYVLGASKKVAAYGNHGCYYWGTLPASADQRIASDFEIGDYGTEAGKAVYVAGRIDSSSDTLYRAGRVDGYWKIEKVVNGTVTSIGTPVQDYVHNVTQRATLEIKTVGGNVELKLYRDAEVSPIVSGTDSSSPITANGYAGLQELSGTLLRLDNFYAETIEAGGNATDATSVGAPDALTLIAPTGVGMGTAAGSTSGIGAGSIASCSLVSIAGTGAGTSIESGTLTTASLMNNAKVPYASLPGWTLNIFNKSTGALVLQATSLSTDASGRISVTNAALIAGTEYAYEPVHTTYGRRLPLGTAV